MDRNIPEFNRIVMTKIHKKNLQTHYKKLFSIQKSRKRTDASLNLSKYNLKGQQLQQQRKTEIDKGNVLLFQKMNKIMKRTDPLNQKINRNHKISSNKFAEYIQRINQENQHFLQRLCQSKPTIDNKKMHEQRQKQLSILRLLGRNPLQASSERQKINLNEASVQNRSNRYDTQVEVKSTNNRYRNPSMVCLSENFNLQLNPRPQYTQAGQDTQILRSQEYFKKQILKMQERKKRVKSSIQQMCFHKMSKFQAKPQTKSQLKQKWGSNQAQGQEYSIVWDGYKVIEDCMYKVVVLEKMRSYKFICTQASNLHRQLQLDLAQTEAAQLLSRIDFDYQLAVDSLQIKEDALFIDINKIYSKASLPSPAKMIKIKKKANSSIAEQPIEHQNTVFLEQAIKAEKKRSVVFKSNK